MSARLHGLDRRQLAIVLAGFLAFLNLYPPQALLPQLQQAFGVSAVATAGTVSAGTLSVALVAPLAGLLADTLGRQVTLAVALLGLAVTTAFSGSAESLSQMLLWRFLCGLFIPGIVTAAVGSIGEEREPKRAVHLAGIYIGGTVLGGFFGRFLAGLVAQYFGWRMAFWSLGLLTLLLAPFVITGIRGTGTAQRESGRTALRSAALHLRNRNLLVAFGVGFLLLFSLVGTFTYASLHLAAPPYGLSSAALGTLFAVYLTGVVASPWTGAWVVRHGRRKVATAAGVLAMTGTLVALADPIPVIVVGLAIACAGIFVLQSLATGYLPEAAKTAKSSAAGLYTSAYYLGGSLGGVVPAALWTHFGWPGCVTLLVVVNGIAMAVCRRLWK